MLTYMAIHLNFYVNEIDVITYDRTYHIVVYHKRMGQIHIPDGKLIIRDPLLSDSQQTIIDVNPGTYEIFKIIGFDYYGPYEEIKGVSIGLKKGPAVSWKPVPDPNELGEIIGYTVDSSTSAILNLQASQLLDSLMDNDYEETSKIIYESRDADGTIYLRDNEADKAFVFGLPGDGSYPCFLGMDQMDEPTTVILPFDFFKSNYSNFEQTIYPPIPQGFDAHFFDWMKDMNQFLKDKLSYKEGLSIQEIEKFEREIGGAIPDDIKLYYLNFSPFTKFDLSSWISRNKEIQNELNTSNIFLPIEDDYVVALVDTKGDYEIMDSFGGLTLGFDFCQNHLKVYLVGRLMSDMGEVQLSTN